MTIGAETVYPWYYSINGTLIATIWETSIVTIWRSVYRSTARVKAESKQTLDSHNPVVELLASHLDFTSWKPLCSWYKIQMAEFGLLFVMGVQ